EYLTYLAREGKMLDVGEALDLTRQVADALAYAHAQGMVHRDIKPDNVLLKPVTSGGTTNGFRAVLTDFGLAKLAESIVQSMPGTTMGTYPYMSPEQCRGEEVDGRTDIYALGVMLYELVVGRLPFNPKTITEAIRMHTSDPLPMPTQIRPGIPAAISEIILKALAKSPSERYQSGSDMARALGNAAGAARSMVTIPPPKQPSAMPESIPTTPESLLTYLASQPPISDLPAYTAQALPASQATMDRVIIASQSGETKTFALDKPVLTIGRDSTSDIILKGEKVSRSHAKIERKADGSYTLTDLGSTNGSYVAGQKLLPNIPQKLDYGVQARVGEFGLRIEAGRAAQPSPSQLRTVGASPDMARTVMAAGMGGNVPPPAQVGFAISGYPAKLKAPNPFMLTINNRSNVRASFNVNAADNQRLLSFGMAQPVVSLEPGETQTLPISITPIQRPALGGALIPFRVIVEVIPDPVNGILPGAADPQLVDSELQVSPSIPSWLFPAALFACAVLVALSIPLISLVNNNRATEQAVIAGRTLTAQALLVTGTGTSTPTVTGTATPDFNATIGAQITLTQVANATLAGNFVLTQLAINQTGTAAAGNNANGATQTAIANYQATLFTYYNILTATAQAAQATQFSFIQTATMAALIAQQQGTQTAISVNSTNTAIAQTQQANFLTLTSLAVTVQAQGTQIAATQTALAGNATATAIAGAGAATQTQAAINAQATINAGVAATLTQNAINAQGTANAGANAAATATASAVFAQGTANAIVFATQTQDAINLGGTAVAVAATQTQDAINLGGTAVAVAATQTQAFFDAQATANAALTLTALVPTATTAPPVINTDGFRFTGDGSNTFGNQTILDALTTNGQPGKVVFAVSMVNGAAPVYNANPLGVYFTGSQWAVFNENNAAMPIGASFLVYSINPGAAAFTHTAVGHSGPTSPILNPALTGNSSAIVIVTQNWGASVNNPNEVAVFFDGSNWVVTNLNGAELPQNSAFNVLVGSPSGNAFMVIADGSNTIGALTYLDTPALNGRPDAVFLITKNLTTGGVVVNEPVAAYYDPARNQWAVSLQSGDMFPPNMPIGAAFNIIVVQ
ncbi:MAG TPA: FHA domain-containing serine/threonine-protein kinase, partial [Aggregatilineales bacterium]|nr:FHA domain-containing serine/threonine-protein kinase [Aggregatilineales bacterium]